MGKGWGVRRGVEDRGRLGGHGQLQIFVCCFLVFSCHPVFWVLLLLVCLFVLLCYYEEIGFFRNVILNREFNELH